MSADFQGSFTGGELDPSLSARVDITKYGVGCKTLKNFVVQAHGGVYRRPGLSFVLKALGITKLISFQYNVEQVYVLAFSDLKMRVFKDGGVVLDTSVTTNISAIIKANPCQITTSSAHGLTTGDDVYISGIVGMTELNGRFFAVSVIDTTNFTLDGIDSTGYTTYVSDGTAAKVYTETSPYAVADLDGLYVAQSADTMYICHSGYAPRKLTRADHDDWTFTTVSLGTSMTAPANLEVLWDGQANLDAAKNITGALRTNPVIITATGHGYVTHDEVFITGVGGMTEINDRYFRITWLTVNTFSLDGEDGAGHTVYTSGGTSERLKGLIGRYKVTSVNLAGEESLASESVAVASFAQNDWVAEDHIHVGWDAAADAVEYYVYKESNGVYGYMGTTTALEFRDDNFAPDLLYVPAEHNDPFSGGAGYYPSSVAFFSQRLWYGGSNKFPQTIWASQIGLFENFNKGRPLRDSDSLSFTLASTQVNAIQWLMFFSDLLIGTSGAEWKLFSTSEGAITPSTTDTRAQSYWGSAAVIPVIIGDGVVHVQRQGSAVRDLFFSLEKDSYAGNDLTIMVRHLFQGKQIVSWAYQRSPDSILWCVTNDGDLYGLTYHKEHQVWGWHRHETDGTFESVASIPGDNYDDVYFVVNRTIETETVRYIERMNDKWLITEGINTAMFLDSALSYSDSAEKVFRGLDHLNGETVEALVDGSPEVGLVVADGTVTLTTAGSVVHIGLATTSTLAPMGVEELGRATVSIGRVKSLSKIIIRFMSTVGGKMGPELDRLDPLKFTPTEYGQAINPDEVLDYEFVPQGKYGRDGSFYIVQDQPLPMTILAVMPEFVKGGM